jgi:glycolate oxidase FAD binding subunit
VAAPQTPGELAETLGAAAGRRQTIALNGNSTKRRMAGPVEAAEIAVSTVGLCRVLQYDPRDLTISVEAGVPWRELTRVLAENRQMVPLDPPFAAGATVGGVVSSNSSGPRRRLYGTARDLVIGMKFATLEGKLVQSGGMVVKNVAGLDMAKLLIGSFGTLAGIAVVNFKVLPIPEVERSFVFAFDSAASAAAARDRVLKSFLQPSAIDLLNPAAAAEVGNQAWLLAIRAGGNAAAIDRYERELAPLGEGKAFEGAPQDSLWQRISDYAPAFLAKYADGAVVRASCTLKEVPAVMESLEVPALARAGSGVCHGFFERPDQAAGWISEGCRRGWKIAVEYSPEARKRDLELWPAPGNDLEMMRRVKNLFDPANLLNRGRLYGRI